MNNAEYVKTDSVYGLPIDCKKIKQMTMRKLNRNIYALTGVGLLATGSCSIQKQEPKYNVLFIIMDDLNTMESIYGYTEIHTPNYERLAKRSVVFTHAHCPAPVSCPSRTAFITGVAPYHSGVYFNNQRYYDTIDVPNAPVTLFKQFKNNGYLTASYGKVLHFNNTGFNKKPEEIKMISDDYTPGYFMPSQDYGYGMKPFITDYFCSLDSIAWGNKVWADLVIWGALPDTWDRDDESKQQEDTRNTNRVVAVLKEKHENPFIAALGIFRPHLPYIVPKRFYDIYPIDKIKIPVGYKEDDLNDLPPIAVQMARGDKKYDILKKENLLKSFIQGYCASITYADEQLGKVLDALENSEYAKNTIVVLCGDNGYHLGEKEHVQKMALWDKTTHIPMLYSLPGYTDKGRIENTAVSLQDIYPTLISLCKLKPAEGFTPGGVDISPILKGEKTERGAPVITTLGKNNHAISSATFRYISYRDGSEELYDLQNDPYEWCNLTGKKEYEDEKNKLKKYVPLENAENKTFFGYLVSKAREQWSSEALYEIMNK